MLTMLKWEMHIIRDTVLRSLADRHSEPSRFGIPDGINPDDVEVWFFELYDSVTRDDMSRFCEAPSSKTNCVHYLISSTSRPSCYGTKSVNSIALRRFINMIACDTVQYFQPLHDMSKMFANVAVVCGIGGMNFS